MALSPSAPATGKKALPADGELDLGAMLQPPAPENKFALPGWHVWCGAPTCGGDGKYHLFYSRWPAEKTFHPGWAIHSEIAYAVSEHPAGPYRHVNVALPARGRDFWDGSATHNPNILQKDGKYYLFYTGNRGDGTYEVHRNHQRVGVAVAAKPEGPWTRFDEPIIDVSPEAGAFDELIACNPAATVRPDGKILLIYKGAEKKAGEVMGGKVRHGAALADQPEGPYTRAPGRVFEADEDTGEIWMLAEDPFIWHSDADGCYYAITRDVTGRFMGEAGGLALFTSGDGLRWISAKHPRVLSARFPWQDGTINMNRVERPALLLENNIPIAFFGATDGYEPQGRPSFNLAWPLKPQP